MNDLTTSTLLFSKTKGKWVDYALIVRFLRYKYKINVPEERIVLIDRFLQSQKTYNIY
ncbi:MAG: hypothetical protein P8I82_08275 [Flavobacteriales bacterium]|nr:hypothetical protein [Flavobacteriales bacterium]